VLFGFRPHLIKTKRCNATASAALSHPLRTRTFRGGRWFCLKTITLTLWGPKEAIVVPFIPAIFVSFRKTVPMVVLPIPMEVSGPAIQKPGA
jgi:hypothetical protein